MYSNSDLPLEILIFPPFTFLPRIVRFNTTASNYMESENSSGGCSSYVPPRRLTKKRKRETADAIGNGKTRRHSSQVDMAAGSSQLVGKKRCRDIEALPKGRAEDEEDTVILSKVEDNIQQLCQRVDFVYHQVHLYYDPEI